MRKRKRPDGSETLLKFDHHLSSPASQHCFDLRRTTLVKGFAARAGAPVPLRKNSRAGRSSSSLHLGRRGRFDPDAPQSADPARAAVSRRRRHTRGKREWGEQTLKQACFQEYPEAQHAFKDLMIHGILQFTLRIAFRCVLHRCENQDIHC